MTCQTGNTELLPAGLSSHLLTPAGCGTSPTMATSRSLQREVCRALVHGTSKGDRAAVAQDMASLDSNSFLGSKTACPRQARPDQASFLSQGGQAASRGAGGLANGALELGHSSQGQSQRARRPWMEEVLGWPGWLSQDS